MSDEIDEWAHEMRAALDKAMAEGLTTITITAPVKAFNVVVDIVHAHFRDTSRTCAVCGTTRRSNALAERLEDWRFKKEQEMRNRKRPHG